MPEVKEISTRDASLTCPVQDGQLTDEKDGAWAEGKAPLSMLTEFMSKIQENDLEAALELAENILAFEPQNKTIQEFIPTLRKKRKLDDEQGDNEAESEEEEEDQSSTSCSSSEEDDEEIIEKAEAKEEGRNPAKKEGLCKK